LTVGTKALIYIQPGSVSVHKQTQLCLRYAMEPGWSFAIVPAGAWRQAVQLIREGQASTLLLAYRDKHTEEIVRAVEAVGGSVEICRPGRSGRSGRPESSPPAGQTTDAIVWMATHGGTTGEIVRLLGVAEERVRPILDRLRRRK
jgi:hypothetical protein